MLLGILPAGNLKYGATFAVRLSTLANIKSMTFLHKNNQLYFGYEDPAQKQAKNTF
jgi:hypothetical protein